MSLGMSLGSVPIFSLPVSYPCFEIRENPNLVKAGKPSQIWFGLDGYPQVWILLSCLTGSILNNRLNLQDARNIRPSTTW